MSDGLTGPPQVPICKACEIVVDFWHKVLTNNLSRGAVLKLGTQVSSLKLFVYLFIIFDFDIRFYYIIISYNFIKT